MSMDPAVEAEAAALGLEFAPLAIISFRDFEKRKNEIAKDLFNACATAGFFYIVDHDLPQNEVEKLYGLAQEAHKLPLETHKLFKSSAAVDGNYHGYVGSVDVNDGVTSYYNITKPDSVFVKPLPEVLEKRLPEMNAFQEKLLDFNDRILRVLSIAMQLPEDYLSKLHGRKAKSNSHLRLMWYPARNAARDQELNNVRIYGHTDYGSITSMMAPSIVALQVLDNVDLKTWRYVRPLKGAIVCNIGDTLQFMTAGLVKSTQHRVVRPPLPSQVGQHRYNVLYFLRADDDAKLLPPPSPLVPKEAASLPGMGMTAGDWVAARVKATVKSNGYDEKKTNSAAEREEYNRLQRIINKGQNAEKIEDPFARL